VTRLPEALLFLALVIVSAGAGMYSPAAGVIVFGVGLVPWTVFCVLEEANE
jgi:hypothetical protein